jgi:fucose permease
MEPFRRDRLTWLAYGMLAWFAYLQAAPGLIVPHLRDELHLSYATGGLHVAAWAGGSVIAGLTATAVERGLGRRTVFWLAPVGMGAGLVVLTLGRVAPVTTGALLFMGVCGGMLLITIQAALADRHGARRTVALTEANVSASVAYVVLIGALSLAAATGAGWRVALLAALAVPPVAWLLNRREPIDAPPPPPADHGAQRLPLAFWIAAATMFCTTSAEWCVTGWGASFVKTAAHVSTDTGISLMIGYFGGVVAGRAIGSRLARRYRTQRLLAVALAVTAAGFAVLWPAATPAQALAGLAITGLGLGNLFPLALSFTVSLAPDRAQLASGRAVLVTSSAVLIAPLTVGAVADATSLTAALAAVPLALALAAAGLTTAIRVHSSRAPAASAARDNGVDAHGLVAPADQHAQLVQLRREPARLLGRQARHEALGHAPVERPQREHRGLRAHVEREQRLGVAVALRPLGQGAQRFRQPLGLVAHRRPASSS